MLSKVLKNLKAKDKNTGIAPDASYVLPYKQSKSSGNGGFHAKDPSSRGEERRRSMGNRLNKPTR
ncbi:MAG: hypothetical protein HOE80_01035 [Candidatus Magasanikbacteria bacterium]|jgi:hypothetical protein|nr:hypothetical protein [Candidatus Magasanikbacteria bacterium]MBT4071288.1 hypothetical protein [Candidatus Magasanikbacteria bacterium]